MDNTIIGLEALLKKFNNISNMSDDIVRGLEKGCMRIERDAKINCPVDDGTLRASITHDVNKSTLTGIVGTNVEYGPYVEFGTGIYVVGGRKTPWVFKNAQGKFYWTEGQAPQPFLLPAYKKNINKALKDISDSIKKGIQGGV